jgi:hypothetical protein
VLLLPRQHPSPLSSSLRTAAASALAALASSQADALLAEVLPSTPSAPELHAAFLQTLADFDTSLASLLPICAPRAAASSLAQGASAALRVVTAFSAYEFSRSVADTLRSFRAAETPEASPNAHASLQRCILDAEDQAQCPSSRRPVLLAAVADALADGRLGAGVGLLATQTNLSLATLAQITNGIAGSLSPILDLSTDFPVTSFPALPDGIPSVQSTAQWLQPLVASAMHTAASHSQHIAFFAGVARLANLPLLNYLAPGSVYPSASPTVSFGAALITVPASADAPVAVSPDEHDAMLLRDTFATDVLLARALDAANLVSWAAPASSCRGAVCGGVYGRGFHGDDFAAVAQDAVSLPPSITSPGVYSHVVVELDVHGLALAAVMSAADAPDSAESMAPARGTPIIPHPTEDARDAVSALAQVFSSLRRALREAQQTASEAHGAVDMARDAATSFSRLLPALDAWLRAPGSLLRLPGVALYTAQASDRLFLELCRLAMTVGLKVISATPSRLLVETSHDQPAQALQQVQFFAKQIRSRSDALSSVYVAPRLRFAHSGHYDGAKPAEPTLYSGCLFVDSSNWFAVPLAAQSGTFPSSRQTPGSPGSPGSPGAAARRLSRPARPAPDPVGRDPVYESSIIAGLPLELQAFVRDLAFSFLTLVPRHDDAAALDAAKVRAEAALPGVSDAFYGSRTESVGPGGLATPARDAAGLKMRRRELAAAGRHASGTGFSPVTPVRGGATKADGAALLVCRRRFLFADVQPFVSTTIAALLPDPGFSEPATGGLSPLQAFTLAVVSIFSVGGTSEAVLRDDLLSLARGWFSLAKVPPAAVSAAIAGSRAIPGMAPPPFLLRDVPCLACRVTAPISLPVSPQGLRLPHCPSCGAEYAANHVEGLLIARVHLLAAAMCARELRCTSCGRTSLSDSSDECAHCHSPLEMDGSKADSLKAIAAVGHAYKLHRLVEVVTAVGM